MNSTKVYHHVYENPGFLRFQFAGRKSSCYLHYVRKGALQFRHPELGVQLLPEQHFQVYFFNAPLQSFMFTGASKYSLLTINFDRSILEPLMSTSFSINNFLTQSSGAEMATMFDVPLHITPENKRILNDIFQENWSAAHLENIVQLVLSTAADKSSHLANTINGSQSRDNAPVYAVAEWILLNIEEAVSIESLSKKFYINEFKLKKNFREVFGVPIITFQRKARMEKAKQLLLHTDLPVSEIAFMVGFTQSTYFSDFFRRQTGASPSSFRRENILNENVSLIDPVKSHNYF